MTDSRVALWRIERSVDGRVHRLEARAEIPVGLGARYVRPDSEDVELDEFTCLFLDEALKGAAREAIEWRRASEIDPWRPGRQDAAWSMGRRLGRRRLDLKADLTPKGRPLLVMMENGKVSFALSIEEALFLRQALAALIAEQECLAALGDEGAADYGCRPGGSGRNVTKWEEADKATAARLWGEGVDVTTIAEFLERPEVAVALTLARMGVAESEAVLLTSRSVPEFYPEKASGQSEPVAAG